LINFDNLLSIFSFSFGSQKLKLRWRKKLIFLRGSSLLFICALHASHKFYFAYRELLERLQDYRGECELVTEQLDMALDHLTDLRERYIHVSTKTNALHEACENALDEQVPVVCLPSLLLYISFLFFRLA
jgi:hypothetical protein